MGPQILIGAQNTINEGTWKKVLHNRSELAQIQCGGDGLGGGNREAERVCVRVR